MGEDKEGSLIGKKRTQKDSHHMGVWTCQDALTLAFMTNQYMVMTSLIIILPQGPIPFPILYNSDKYCDRSGKRDGLTGTESSADRSELLLPLGQEKTESGPANGSDGVVQMLGNELQSPLMRPPETSSGGNSSKSSMWSKKLPQSISSMKLGPIIFFFLRNKRKWRRR